MHTAVTAASPCQMWHSAAASRGGGHAIMPGSCRYQPLSGHAGQLLRVSAGYPLWIWQTHGLALTGPESSRSPLGSGPCWMADDYRSGQSSPIHLQATASNFSAAFELQILTWSGYMLDRIFLLPHAQQQSSCSAAAHAYLAIRTAFPKPEVADGSFLLGTGQRLQLRNQLGPMLNGP